MTVPGNGGERRVDGRRTSLSRAAKLFAAALGLCLVSGLLVVAALWGVVSGWQRERITELAEVILAKTLDTPVAIEALDGSLISEFSIRGLRIGTGPSAPIVARRIALRFDARSILQRRISIEHLDIEGASIVLTRSRDGTLGIAGLSDAGRDEGDGEPSPWSFELAEFLLRESDLQLAFEDEPDRSGSLRIAARGGGISLPPDPSSLPAWRLAFLAEEGRADLGEALRLDNAHVAGALAGGQLEISDAALSGSFGDVELAGSVAVVGWLDSSTAGRADLDLSLRAFDPAPLGGPQGRIDASARLEANVAAQRPLSEISIAGSLVLTPSTLAGRALHSGNLVGKLDRSGWSLTRAELFGEGIEIVASGSGSAASIDALDLRAVAKSVESLVAGDPGLAGNVELTASLSGSWERPVGTALLRVRQFQLASVDLGELTMDLRSSVPGRIEVVSMTTRGGELDAQSSGVAGITLDQTGAQIDGFRLAAQKQSLSASGRLAVGGFEDFRLAVENVDVETLGRLSELSVEATGRVDASLVLNGPYQSPNVSGSLDWGAGRIDAFAFDRIRAEVANTRGDSFDVVAAVEQGGRSVVDAKISLPREESLFGLLASPRTSVRLTADGFPLKWLSSLLPEDVALQSGILHAQVDLRGGTVPKAAGRIELEDALVTTAADAGTPIPVAAVLDFEPHAEGIQISNAEISIAGAPIRISGIVTDAALRGVRVESVGVDLAQLFALLGIDVDASGAVSLALQADGSFERPVASGRVTWRDARYGEIDLDEVNIDLEVGDSRLASRLTVLGDGRDLLVVDSKVARTSDAFRNLEQLLRDESTLTSVLEQMLRDESLEASFEAHDVPIRIFQPFVPRQLRELGGRLDARLKLRGGQPVPSIEGVAELFDGRLAVPILRQTFEPVTGLFVVSERSIRVERAQIGEDGASAKLTGNVGLDGVSTSDLALDLALDHFPLSRSSLMSADASGKAELRGTLEAPRLDGQLALSNASASLRSASDPAFKEIRILAAPSAAGDRNLVETAEPRQGWAETATARFRLAVPRDSWIRGNGTELDVTGNLEFHKEPGAPATLVGEAEIVRGRYKFLTKRFDIRRGTAVFDGSEVPDPLIDIEATHRVRDVTIVLFASGRASEPNIRLSSEPEMSETDVIAYLVAGRPADQLAGAEGSSAGLESVAASFAAGIAATQAAELLADQIPLIDTVDIQIGESGIPSRVSVGKYVGERVFVRYGKSIADQADEASVELKLTPNWSVQSTVTTDETAGADVIWTFDF